MRGGKSSSLYRRASKVLVRGGSHPARGFGPFRKGGKP